MLKRLYITVFLVLFLSFQTHAQTVVVEEQTHSVFKGVFFKVWSKLKSLNPHRRQDARSQVVYTAGIRGEEATETLIQPYWKGDLSEDDAFQEELNLFSSAQQFMDDGELENSLKAFSEFRQRFASSSLAANAEFGHSLSLAGLGRTEDAVAGLEQFVSSHPNHPLSPDAEQIISSLR